MYITEEAQHFKSLENELTGDNRQSVMNIASNKLDMKQDLLEQRCRSNEELQMINKLLN